MIWLTSILLFLIYLNAPAVAVRIHGAPFFLGALVPLALAIPVAHRVLVRNEELRFPRLLMAAVVMLLLHMVSALSSFYPQESMTALQDWFVEGILLALLIANAIRTRAELQAAMFAIITAGAVMGAIAVAQQFLGPAEHPFLGFGQLDSQITDDLGHIQYRLSGPIGETNRYAQIMAVLLPIAAGCALVSRGLRSKCCWLATLLISAAVALTFSRGAIVALIMVIPVALAFGMLRVRHLAFAGMAAGCLLIAMPNYADRVFSIAEVAMEGIGLRSSGVRISDGAARGRVTEMKAAGLLFMENPILGAGPGLAPHYYEQYARVVGGKVRPGTRRSHNLFLQLGGETGVVGLAAFLWVIALTLRGLDRTRKRTESSDRQLWGIVCGLELAVIISLTTSLFLHAAYIRYFWILLGLSAAASVQQGAPALVALLARMFRETADRIRADA
jgi:O-antigen ligase